MTTASLFLLLCIAVVFLIDWSTLRRRGRRVLVLEAIAFLVGGTFVAFPHMTQVMATAVGIGRGVDLILYLAIIWLVRETLMSRHARLIEAERLTGVVRALAVAQATSNARGDGQAAT